MNDNAGSSPALRFVLDSNIIGRNPSGADELWDLHERGQIELLRTDVMDTELGQRADPEHRSFLLGQSSALRELLGPVVWGHSRWGHSTWGDEQGQDLIDQVLVVLRPGQDRSTASKQDLRDVMHVATAIACGAKAFVTMDGSGKDDGILRRAQPIRKTFPGFEVWTPADALAYARSRLSGEGVATTG